jgi:double-stranded uracil-DNA glycosylase
LPGGLNDRPLARFDLIDLGSIHRCTGSMAGATPWEGGWQMPRRPGGPAPSSGRPTRREVAAAYGKTVPDLIAPGLEVLFCGINPSLYSAAVGYHFARPGNRFWPALHGSGFTPRLLVPAEQDELLSLGLGITNVVARATARADELTTDEMVAGGVQLRAKVHRLRPRWLAVCGVTAYRTAFDAPKAVVGEQPTGVGATRVWVLPNPSGLNAHYSAAALAGEFARLRDAAG